MYGASPRSAANKFLRGRNANSQKIPHPELRQLPELRSSGSSDFGDSREDFGDSGQDLGDSDQGVGAGEPARPGVSPVHDQPIDSGRCRDVVPVPAVGDLVQAARAPEVDKGWLWRPAEPGGEVPTLLGRVRTDTNRNIFKKYS